MSIVVFRKDISQEQIETITRVLSFVPTPKIKSRNYYQEQKSEPVQAWLIEDLPDGTVLLRVPFQVGRALFNKINTVDFLTTNFKSKVSPYEYQDRAIDKAVDILTKYSTVLLKMRMALGKSVTSLSIAIKSGLKVMVLCPILKLSLQWIGEIHDKTTAKTWSVGEEAEPDEWDVAVCFYHEKRIEKIPIGIRHRIGMLIIDESHMFNNKTGVNAVLSFNPKYIIACTGTPSRSTDGMDKIMYSVIGDNEVEVESPVNITVLKYHTNLIADRQQGSRGVDWTVLKQSLLYNENRNDQIVNTAKMLIERGIKTLIIAFEVKHILLLHERIKEFYPQTDYICKGKSDYNDSLLTIGINKSTGTGFDEANACSTWDGTRIRCVLLTLSVGNIENLKQYVGRAFRHQRPILCYFVDKDRNVMNHYNLINTWKKEGGIKPNVIHTSITGIQEEIDKISDLRI